MRYFEVTWAGADWRKHPAIVRAWNAEQARDLAERAYPGRRASQVLALSQGR